MHKFIIVGLGFLFVSLFAWAGNNEPVATAPARPATAATQPKGEVTLSVKGDGIQPTGWPVVLQVTLTNISDKPIGWWCGGPDVYPPAHHFKVQVRYGTENQWHAVQATNGQYVKGSGFQRRLQPHQSITVPLAIPVEKNEGIWLRVVTKDWPAKKPAETYVRVLNNRRALEKQQAKVIAEVITQQSPFERHLAERYADRTVIDAMLKLVTVDNASVTKGAACVLARQALLPESAGGDLAATVKRWLAKSPWPDWGGLQANVVEAALKTRSAAAREAVINVLKNPTTANSRWIALNGLRLSPGDNQWLRQARDEIATVQKAAPNDVDLAKQAKLAVDWLNARLANQGRPQRKDAE